MGFCSHIEGVRCANCAHDPWQPPILAQYAGTFALLADSEREDYWFRCGAAVAFGLMGMAEAVRARQPVWHNEPLHGRTDDDFTFHT